MQAHRRHDISDIVWEILEPLLPGCEGRVGRPASDNRLFITLFSGYCELVLHGEICRRTMGTGKIHTAVFIAGATEEFGKFCLNRSSPNRTTND